MADQYFRPDRRAVLVSASALLAVASLPGAARALANAPGHAEMRLQVVRMERGQVHKALTALRQNASSLSQLVLENGNQCLILNLRRDGSGAKRLEI